MIGDLPAVRGDLAPTGTLRAAINLVNTVLVREHPRSGVLDGIAVDLARVLARRLGVRLTLVTFHGAATVMEAAGTGAWDVAFLAIEPARAAHVAFTDPYLLIAGGYVVEGDSPLRTADEVDRPGARVAVGAGSAYDLYLTRTLQHASLVRAPAAGSAVTDLFLAGGLDVVAGLRPMLATFVARRPALRLLDGSFMTIRQAMCTAPGRAAGHRYLQGFIEEMKRSGGLARALRLRDQREAVVAPPGPGTG
jgi:polar amino acid transport system substrate-binding protein